MLDSHAEKLSQSSMHRWLVQDQAEVLKSRGKTTEKLVVRDTETEYTGEVGRHRWDGSCDHRGGKLDRKRYLKRDKRRVYGVKQEAVIENTENKQT